jgi:hypothetical protein
MQMDEGGVMSTPEQTGVIRTSCKKCGAPIELRMPQNPIFMNNPRLALIAFRIDEIPECGKCGLLYLPMVVGAGVVDWNFVPAEKKDKSRVKLASPGLIV